MQYTTTRTITGPSIQKQRVIIQEHNSIRDAGSAIYFWLIDNGYQSRSEARLTAAQAEKDKEYTGYGSTWTITPTPKVQVTKDGPAYLLPGVEPASKTKDDTEQLAMF